VSVGSDAYRADPESTAAARPYMSATQLAAVTPWTVNAIRKMVARRLLKRGVHYFQPLGRRREVVFKWSAIVGMIEQQPGVMEEADSGATLRPRRAVGMDVEQATASFERLLS